LVNGLARAGDGIADFVIPGEDVVDKVGCKNYKYKPKLIFVSLIL